MFDLLPLPRADLLRQLCTIFAVLPPAFKPIDVAERAGVRKVDLDDTVAVVEGALGYGHRDNSSWKGTSARGAGEVPTLGAATARAEAEAATGTIGVASEGADMDETDPAGVRHRVVGWQGRRVNRKHLP
jgi:hypothetical protein